MNKHILESELLARRDPVQAVQLSRFFRTAPGEYGEGDCFLGVRVPVTRQVVRFCRGRCGLEEVQAALPSRWHEVRLAALLLLTDIFRHAPAGGAVQRQCVELYLGGTEYINNWDLVDLSCYELLGRWLLERDRTLLYSLARSEKNIWEPRIAMVTTMQFLRHGELADTFAIAEILLSHPHDLIHKAVGWLLREAGKRDRSALSAFLESHLREMSRTTLRYAVEKYPEPERLTWLRR